MKDSSLKKSKNSISDSKVLSVLKCLLWLFFSTFSNINFIFSNLFLTFCYLQTFKSPKIKIKIITKVAHWTCFKFSTMPFYFLTLILFVSIFSRFFCFFWLALVKKNCFLETKLWWNDEIVKFNFPIIPFKMTKDFASVFDRFLATNFKNVFLV